MKRLWYCPDGRVMVQGFASDDPRIIAAAVQSLRSVPAGSLHEDVTDAEFIAMMPKDGAGKPDSSQSHKWRKNPRGKGFIVDASVPDAPGRVSSDEIDQARTVDDLKTLLRRMVG